MDLHLLLVLFTYFLVGFVGFDCESIFTWKTYLWEFFETHADSSSRENLCLLWPSTIGTIYPGPF